MLSSGKQLDNSYFGQYYVTSMCSKSILSATVYQARIELWQTSCCRSYGYCQKHNPMIRLKLAGQQAKQTCIRHHSWSDRPYYGTQSTSLLSPFQIILESFLFFQHAEHKIRQTLIFASWTCKNMNIKVKDWKSAWTVPSTAPSQKF